MVPKGVALGRLPDGRPVFVKGGAPNEEAEVRLTRIKKDFAEAYFERAIQPSPDRSEADYPNPALAGADWHYLSYQAQLQGKQSIVSDLITHAAQLELEIPAVVGADHIWRYRNKVELTFGQDDRGTATLGFHAPGSFDKIIPTDDSALFPEVIRDVIAAVLSWAHENQLEAYNPRRKTGFLRNLVIRRTEHGNDLVVNLVTGAGVIPEDSFLFALRSLPLTSIIWSENTSAATIVRVDKAHILKGAGYLTETFLDMPIRYGFDSFFQTNTSMAEKLAKRALEVIKDLQPEVVIDGYAGVGGFGLFAARDGARVVSIESHPASSQNAQENAAHLGLTDKMTFINEPMESYLQSQDSKFDLQNSVLIVDPPRSGLHPKAVKAIAESGPKHVLYVSCGPVTLARDLMELSKVYGVAGLQPFDLFPQTSHVETFVQLIRKI